MTQILHVTLILLLLVVLFDEILLQYKYLFSINDVKANIEKIQLRLQHNGVILKKKTDKLH